MSQLVEPTFEDRVLYHYTSFHAFYNIIETRELWATCIHYLNDHTEFKHAIQICTQELKTLQMDSSLRDSILNRLDCISNINLFVTSFSLESDLLSQWRGYCKPYGISIGFSYAELQKIAHAQQFMLLQCIYDDAVKKERIRNHVSKFISDLKTKPAAALDDHISEFLNSFLPLALSCKHNAFKEEKEYRLASMPIECISERYDIRPIPTMLIPYCRFNLAARNQIGEHGKQNLGLQKIVIGPNQSTELARQSTINFLNNKKIQWHQVGVSSVPYRQLG